MEKPSRKRINSIEQRKYVTTSMMLCLLMNNDAHVIEFFIKTRFILIYLKTFKIKGT